MSDELVCRIVGQLCDVINKLEDQLHELRHMRQMMNDWFPAQPKPFVRRNPPERRGKPIQVKEIGGDDVHDLGMQAARNKANT